MNQLSTIPMDSPLLLQIAQKLASKLEISLSDAQDKLLKWKWKGDQEITREKVEELEKELALAKKGIMIKLFVLY